MFSTYVRYCVRPVKGRQTYHEVIVVIGSPLTTTRNGLVHLFFGHIGIQRDLGDVSQREVGSVPIDTYLAVRQRWNS